MTKIKANQLEIVEILNDPLAQATETRNGTLEIATQAEVNGGSPYDNTRAITPETLAGATFNTNWLIANNGADFTTKPQATGSNSVSLGNDATTSTFKSAISIGTTATVSGDYGISMGINSSAAYWSVGIGRNAAAGGLGVAIGNDADVDAAATGGVVVGSQSTISATGGYSVCVGSRCGSVYSSQVNIGHEVRTGTSPTSTDVPYSVKLGYGLGTTDKNLLHLFSKGKLELYGEEAQFIFPNYSPTGSPLTTPLPSTTNQGGTIYDFDTKTLKFYNGTAWTELNSNNWLSANSGNNFTIAPTALFANAIALGHNSQALAPAAIAVGSNVTASVNSVSLGINSDTLGSSSIAIGSNAQSGTGAEGATIAIGLNSSSVLGSQVSIGNGVTGATVTPTDVQFSTKIGYGVTSVDKNMLHLFSKGKLELYGDEAQFIMPNYSVTGSPIDVPAVGVEGGVIYDDVAKGLQVYNGTSWSAVGGGSSNNWLTAHSGNNFATAPSALFSNAIALGHNAIATALEAIAIGSDTISDTNAIAIGTGVAAYAASAIAIGQGSKSGFGGAANCVTLGVVSNTTLVSQVTVGNFINSTSVTPTDVAYSAKLGYGFANTNKNMLHLFSKGKLELYGDEAQFIMPNYSVTGSPIDVPAVAVEGGVIYDDVAKGLQVYNGTSWSAVGGGGGTPGGSDTQIQYNNGGAFGGTTEWTFDDTTSVGKLTGAAAIGSTGVLSVTNSSTVGNAVGVLGTATGGFGTTNGVRGESSSVTTDASGVYGLANGASGLVNGVFGHCSNAQGDGVYGYIPHISSSGNGIHGLSNSTGSAGGFFENISGDDTDVWIAKNDIFFSCKQANVENFKVTGAGDVTAAGNVVSHIAINAQSGLTYTLVLADDGKLVTMDNGSANELTIPTNASVAFPIGTQILVEQEGAGTTSISGGGSPPPVTIHSAGNFFDLASQYTTISLIKKATDTWLIVGDLA